MSSLIKPLDISSLTVPSFQMFTTPNGYPYTGVYRRKHNCYPENVSKKTQHIFEAFILRTFPEGLLLSLFPYSDGIVRLKFSKSFLAYPAVRDGVVTSSDIPDVHSQANVLIQEGRNFFKAEYPKYGIGVDKRGAVTDIFSPNSEEVLSPDVFSKITRTFSEPVR